MKSFDYIIINNLIIILELDLQINYINSNVVLYDSFKI